MERWFGRTETAEEREGKIARFRRFEGERRLQETVMKYDGAIYDGEPVENTRNDGLGEGHKKYTQGRVCTWDPGGDFHLVPSWFAAALVWLSRT